ncbi:MAG: response regulator, partial [Chitinophagaceae bacterium]
MCLAAVQHFSGTRSSVNQSDHYINYRRMKEKILIVEDQFVEADYLRLMLTKAGYQVTGIARSVSRAEEMIAEERPSLVLLDIFLKGSQTGIDLAATLAAANIPFVYLSANSNEEVLNKAKLTQPYGFLVKPFRERDLLVTLEIAHYRSGHSRDKLYAQETMIRTALKQLAATTAEPVQSCRQVATILQPNIPFDYLLFQVEGPSAVTTGFLRIGFNEYQFVGQAEMQVISKRITTEDPPSSSGGTTDAEISFSNGNDFETACKQHSMNGLVAQTFEMASMLNIPLRLHGSRKMDLTLYSRRSDAYTGDHVYLAEHVQGDLRRCMEKTFPAPAGNGEARPWQVSG